MPSPIPIFLALGTLCLGMGIYGVIGPNFYITVFCRMEYRDQVTISPLSLDEKNPLCHTSAIQEKVSSFESIVNLVQGIVQLSLVAQWCFLSDKLGRKRVMVIIGCLFFVSLGLTQIFRTYWYIFSPKWFILGSVLNHSEVLGSLIILYFSDVWEPETYSLYVAWFTGCFLLIGGSVGSTIGAYLAGKTSLIKVSSVALTLLVVFLCLLIFVVKDDRDIKLSNANTSAESNNETAEDTITSFEAIDGVAPLGGFSEVEDRIEHRGLKIDTNVSSQEIRTSSSRKQSTNSLDFPSPSRDYPSRGTTIEVCDESSPLDPQTPGSSRDFTYNSVGSTSSFPDSSKPTYTPSIHSVPDTTPLQPWYHQFLSKINILSPIFTIFSLVPSRDHRNLVLFSIINSLETAAMYSTIYIIALYVQYVYGWTPAELGKVVAFSSALKFVMVAIVTPIVIKYLNNRMTRNDKKVYKHPLPDIPLIRFSMLCGAIYTTSIALTNSGTVFILLQVLSSVRSVAIPARATFVISLTSRENTGKLLGAVELISKLLQIPATSLFLKIYSMTVATYPATVLLIVAVEEWICLGLAAALRNYVLEEGV
ncbi:hypothetical protein CJU90_3078 [Yarrowia sp. C11]|nr:hypothetical protein CKK34_4527 [Yarrowia sp. E02]KAG5369606.1 hypothetical protein CJU90_3078 [Yarrowia sp. C11]